MSFSGKHLFVYYRISGKYSDPSCPSQGDVPSSTGEVPSSHPISKWPLCRPRLGASCCCLVWLSIVNDQHSICRYALTSTFIATYILAPVSLLTLTAISVDRLLALLLGLRYRQVVTLKRTILVVTSFWFICDIGATMYFWNYQITLWFGNICTTLCLLTTTVCYTKIFFCLRHHQNQVQDQEQTNQTHHLNIARYRRAVSSALWLQLTLVACYLPQGITGSLWTNRAESSPTLYLARQFATTLVFVNSSLNPILYCWKIREVRQAVKDTLRHLCCSSN